MYYNEFYENTGECETSFFLGCKECKNCMVKSYNEKVKEELRKEHLREQMFLEKMYGDINLEVEEFNDPYWAQQALDDLNAKYHEINILRKALEELRDDVDIIETAKSVVNKQITEKMIEINKNKYDDQILIDSYKSLYKIDLELMTQEEIDCIDLTVYTDCQPW